MDANTTDSCQKLMDLLSGQQQNNYSPHEIYL